MNNLTPIGDKCLIPLKAIWVPNQTRKNAWIFLQLMVIHDFNVKTSCARWQSRMRLISEQRCVSIKSLIDKDDMRERV